MILTFINTKNTEIGKITQLFFSSEIFKWQSWKTKLENWHEARNKSEITGFYMEKFTGSLGKFLMPIVPQSSVFR